MRPDDPLRDKNPEDVAFAETYEEAVIDSDLPCARCHTNLVGLEITGTCPECDLPIRLSMSPTLLRLTSPDWIRTVIDGCRWLHWSVMGVFYVVAFGVLSWFLEIPVMYALTTLFALVLALLAWNGARKVTATEPEHHGLGRWRSFQSAARVVTHGLFAASVVAAGLCLAGGHPMRWLWAAGAIVAAALLMFDLAAIVLLPMAHRIPDVPLFVSTLMYVIVNGLFTLAVWYIVFPLHQSEAMVPLDNSFVLSALLMTPLVLLMWAVAVYWTFAKSLSAVIHGELAHITGADLNEADDGAASATDTGVAPAQATM